MSIIIMLIWPRYLSILYYFVIDKSYKYIPSIFSSYLDLVEKVQYFGVKVIGSNNLLTDPLYLTIWKNKCAHSAKVEIIGNV